MAPSSQFLGLGGVFRGVPAKREDMKVEIDFNAKTITPLTKVTAKDLADLVENLPGDSSEWEIVPKPEATQIVFKDRHPMIPSVSSPFTIPSRNPIVTL